VPVAELHEEGEDLVRVCVRGFAAHLGVLPIGELDDAGGAVLLHFALAADHELIALSRSANCFSAMGLGRLSGGSPDRGYARCHASQARCWKPVRLLPVLAAELRKARRPP
jgi:hypothetical protein